MMKALVWAFASALVLLAPSMSRADGFEVCNGEGTPGSMGPQINVGPNGRGGNAPAQAVASPVVVVGQPMLVEAIRSFFELRLQTNTNTDPRLPWTEIDRSVVDIEGFERLVRGRDGVNRLETQVFWPGGGYVEANVVGCRQCRTRQAYQQLQNALEDRWRASAIAH